MARDAPHGTDRRRLRDPAAERRRIGVGRARRNSDRRAPLPRLRHRGLERGLGIGHADRTVRRSPGHYAISTCLCLR